MREHSVHWPARLVGLAGVVSAAYWTTLSSRSQLLGRFPFRGAGSEKVIALTFDDGPNEPFTTQIGDFLAVEAIRATFFQVGRCVERFPESTTTLLRQGHVIGNHSYSHELLQCLRPRAQRTQTQAAQNVLTQAIGQTPALYRPPWLLRTPALYGTLRDHNLQPISGEFCHPFEVFQPNPQRMARRALTKVRPGSILIFHDGFGSRRGNRANTVEAVMIVVAELLREGYLFVTVDDLLGIPAFRTGGPYRSGWVETSRSGEGEPDQRRTRARRSDRPEPSTDWTRSVAGNVGSKVPARIPGGARRRLGAAWQRRGGADETTTSTA